MQVSEKLNDAIKFVIGIVFVVMTCVVLLQVFFRYVLNNPIAEFQEISIYAMVYLVMLGCTVAVHNKTHIAVDWFAGKLPMKIQNILALVVLIIMAAFFLILLVKGYEQALRSMLQRSPSTGIPVGYVMFSMPLSAAICLFYIADQFITGLKKIKA